MRRGPPRSTRTYTPFPYTTLLRSFEREANAPGSHPAQVDAGLARLGEQHLAAPRHRQRQCIEKAVVFDGDAEPREAGGQDTGQALHAESDAREPVGAVVDGVERGEHRPQNLRGADVRSEEHTSELQSLMR